MPNKEIIKAGRASCDVLIIGAGPSGSSAAQAAVEEGAGVILIDRRRQIGFPARCAGFIPMAAFNPSEHQAAVTRQVVDKMLIYSPDGTIIEAVSPGYIVNRELLDRSMAGTAAANGAKIITSARAVLHRRGITLVKTASDIIEIESQVVVGADGPRSLAGRWIGSVNQQLVSGAQWTVPLKQVLSHIKIFLHERLPGGYGWIFPDGDRARVGVAVSAFVGLKPAQLLKWFIDYPAVRDIIDARPLAATGGLIPVGGLLPSHKGNILLAGDAAGLCHPLTGAGLALAMQSGRLAGEAAARYAGGTASALADYRQEIESIAKKPLNGALSRRRQLYEMRYSSEKDFCHAVASAWSVFAS